MRRFLSVNLVPGVLWLLIFILAMISNACEPKDAQTDDHILAALQQGRAETGVPGASGTIVVNGGLAWQGVTGLANMESKKSVTADTLFSLASVTKMATSCMTMKLIEEGFISLDETIGRYLPELPRSEKITVRMLLNHTSGLQDYLNNPEIERKLADPYYVWTREEVLGSVKRVVFEPGSAYGYSNTNFVALGTIIELASRNSVAALFRKVILEPLALRHAYFDPDPGAAPSFAHGYVIRANNPVDTFPPDGSVPTGIWGSVWTDGGLATNSADIAVFTDAYLGGRLLKKETMETVLDFGRYDYGLGVSLWRGSGRAWWGHSGGYYGYEAESWTDLSRNLTIAVCVNSSEPSGSADRIWRLLEAAYTKSGIPRGVTREWLQSAPK